MKRLLITALLGIFACGTLCAQNNLSATEDTERIELAVVFADASKIPQYARQSMKTKLDNLTVSCGLGSSAGSRFILTAKVDVMEKQVTASYPVMTIVDIVPTLYIGDGETGQLFATYVFDQMRGMGDNENRAYLSALKSMRTNDPAVKAFVAEGRKAIIEYYNSNIDFIMADAKSLCDSEQYDESMAVLANVPSVCKDAYLRAKEMIGEVYQRKIDSEGKALLAKAHNQWNADKSEDGAAAAIEFLGEINPLSSAAPEADKLSKDIAAHYAKLEARRIELEERQWAFQMKQYEDARADRQAAQQQNYELQKMSIEARKEQYANARNDSKVAQERNYELQKMAIDAAKSIGRASNSLAGRYVQAVTSWLM